MGLWYTETINPAQNWWNMYRTLEHLERRVSNQNANKDTDFWGNVGEWTKDIFTLSNHNFFVCVLNLLYMLMEHFCCSMVTSHLLLFLVHDV